MSGRDPFCRLENSGDLMGGDGAGGWGPGHKGRSVQWQRTLGLGH